MKKLTKDEYDHLNFVPKGIKLNETFQKVMLLNINEALMISDSEWSLKTKPNQYFYINQEKLNGMYFKARRLADDHGWTILRVA